MIGVHIVFFFSIGSTKLKTSYQLRRNSVTFRNAFICYVPTQVVELPDLGGWFCPMKAFRSWQEGRKGKKTGNLPMFVWRDDTPITLRLGEGYTEEDPAWGRPSHVY